jgi:L-cystine uptake protein TcyP (sodium:dicarboxylate symporter family)
MQLIPILLSLAVFGLILFALNRVAHHRVKFPMRVFAGLGLGVLYGLGLQLIFGANSSIVKELFVWVNVVGEGYVIALKMIVVPLVMVSIMSAILNLANNENLQKTTMQILFVLIGTTALSAAIAIVATLMFNLQAPMSMMSAATDARSARLETLATTVEGQHLATQILRLLPVNPFLDMTGVRDTSMIAVVIFSAFFAMATRQIAKKKEKSFTIIKDTVNALHDVIMRMLAVILRLTPYAVAALISKMIATSQWADIMQLIKFVGVSYLVIIIIFIFHLILLAINGLNPFTYVKKGMPAFVFGFTSRTSAGAMPLNIQAQRHQMGVSESAANLSASLGVSIGQNGCAGVYPAMVATMILLTLGEPITWMVVIKLIVVIAVSSFGVAGVGGGATFAALIVLGLMNLPVYLVGLLIAIEPLIDMARTALNISGAMISGVLSSKWSKTIDMSVYNNPNIQMDEDDINA